MEKIDLRKLGLKIHYDMDIDFEYFIERFNLQEKFRELFNVDYLGWDNDISDEEVYEKLFPFINEENKIYFTMYNDGSEINELYYIQADNIELKEEKKRYIE